MLILKFISLAIVISVLHQGISACSLDVRVHDVPPLYYQEDGKWKGVSIELLEALLAEAECKPNYTLVPWKRSLRSMESGRIDVMMNISHSPERAKYMHYVGPVQTEVTVLIVNDDFNYKIESFDDIKNLPGKIVYESGNYYGAAFADKYANDPEFRAKFIQVTHNADIPNMLKAGRAIAELDTLEIALYNVKYNVGYSNMKLYDFGLISAPTFFVFSKASVDQNLILKLQEANIKLLNNDVYKVIVDKWRKLLIN